VPVLPPFVPPPRPADPSSLDDWSICADLLNQATSGSYGRLATPSETLAYCGPEPSTPPVTASLATYYACVQAVNTTYQRYMHRYADSSEIASICGPPP
jgi:hypothetical protein